MSMKSTVNDITDKNYFLYAAVSIALQDDLWFDII
jgi:hypothetical protein